MKLNEELVVRLLDGSGRYMHMQVGNDNLVLGSKHDMYVDYTILDRNLVELDGGEFDFDSSKYAKVNLKTFIPEVIRFAYGRSVSYIITNLKGSDIFIDKDSELSKEVIQARDMVLDMISQHRKIIKSMDIMNGEITFEDIAPVFLNNGEYKFLINFTKRNVWTALHITTAEINKRFSMRSCINIAISRSHINYE